MRGRSRVVWVASVALGLTLVVSGAHARSAPAPTVTIRSAKLTAHWKESWLTGTVSFSGDVSAAAQIEVALRPVTRSGPPAASTQLSTAAAGSFSGTLKLPSRMLPGTYRLSVTGTVAGTSSDPVTRLLVNPAPVEGIVDRSYASLTPGGGPINTAKGPRSVLWVHYHFVVPPKVRKLQVRWHSPDFRWLGIADKTYKLSIASSVQSIGTPLARGVWFAYLFSSKNVVVKRVRVRVS